MRTYRMVAVALFAAASAVFQILHGVIGIPTSFGMVVDLVAFPVLLAFFLFGFEEALNVSILMTIIITLVSPETWLGATMKFAATLPMILVPAVWLLASGKVGRKGSLWMLLAGAAFLSLSLFVLAGTINRSLSFLSDGTAIYSIPQLKLGGAILLKGGPVTPGLLVGGLAPIAGIALVSIAVLFLWRKYGKGVKVSSLSDPRTMALVALTAIIIRGAVTVVANYYYAGPLFFGLPTEKFMATFPWYIIFGWNAIQGIVEVTFAWAIAFKFRFHEYYGS